MSGNRDQFRDRSWDCHSDRGGGHAHGPGFPGGHPGFHHDHRDFRDRNFQCGPPSDREACSDPVSGFKKLLEDMAEEAFTELIREHMKERLKEKWGEEIEGIAATFMDHFIRSREAEMNSVLEGEELDEKLRETLKEG